MEKTEIKFFKIHNKTFASTTTETMFRHSFRTQFIKFYNFIRSQEFL